MLPSVGLYAPAAVEAFFGIPALVVIAERPKLKPHIEAMRAAIAERMGLAPEQVGVKATTNEKLGAEGREEGISCQAVALLSKP